MLPKIVASEKNRALEVLLQNAAEVVLRPEDRFLILSDLHMGDGTFRDDLKKNGKLLAAILSTYYQDQERYSGCVLNGDVQDLLKFSLPEIQQAWGFLEKTLNGFPRTFRLFGNHDPRSEQESTDGVHQALKLLRLSAEDAEVTVPFFVFHGHQVDPLSSGKFEAIIKFVLHYAGVRNLASGIPTPNRVAVERVIAAFSQKHALVSIIGHTHRAFLNRPLLCNSGSVISRKAMTMLELSGKEITLVSWTKKEKSKKQQHEQPPEKITIGNTTTYRHVLARKPVADILAAMALFSSN